MSNRTDWANVADEAIESTLASLYDDAFGGRLTVHNEELDALRERIAVELHNAYVAGQEGSPEVSEEGEEAAEPSALNAAMDGLVASSNLFLSAWRPLAELGACEPVGSADQRRVMEAWYAAGKPDVEPFVRANIKPSESLERFRTFAFDRWIMTKLIRINHARPGSIEAATWFECVVPECYRPGVLAILEPLFARHLGRKLTEHSLGAMIDELRQAIFERLEPVHPELAEPAANGRPSR